LGVGDREVEEDTSFSLLGGGWIIRHTQTHTICMQINPHMNPDTENTKPTKSELCERLFERRLLAGKWMELENIILSEVSLAQKTKNHMFSLIYGH
jgi:hypothetical protein